MKKYKNFQRVNFTKLRENKNTIKNYFNAPIFIDDVSEHKKTTNEFYLDNLRKIYNNDNVLTNKINSNFKTSPKYIECEIKTGNLQLEYNPKNEDNNIFIPVRVIINTNKILVKLSTNETIHKIDLKNIEKVSLAKRNESCLFIKTKEEDEYKLCQFKRPKEVKDWVKDINHFINNCNITDATEKDCKNKIKLIETLIKEFNKESKYLLKKYESNNKLIDNYKENNLDNPLKKSIEFSDQINLKLLKINKCENMSKIKSMIDKFKQNSEKINKTYNMQKINEKLIDQIEENNDNENLNNKNSIEKSLVNLNNNITE